MSKTHHVRTIMTMEGNMRKEVTAIDGRLSRLKKTTYEWQNGVRHVTRETTNFTKKTSGMSRALNGAAMRFVGMTALIGGASIAFQKLNQYIDASVENFRKFENSMAEVSTILTGEAYGAISHLTEGVRQLSVQYGQSAVDMSRGLYQILSAAVDVEKSLNMLNTATKASIAGLTSVETSVDVLTSIINSYGKTVEQAANVSDVLFQTVIRGKLRFEDLASALGYITPIAAAAGVAFEEVAAALATVTRMGLHVDMASRGLALTIQNIVSPTKQAKDAADKYGVEMSAVGIRVNGLTGFIKDLSKAVKEYGLSVLPQMVRNMRSLRVVMALASEEGIKGFAKDLDLMYAATGRTDEALAKMIATQSREAAVVKQSQEIIQREVGKTWSPIKRNIEATKLWFASFLAGGFSIKKANTAIQDLSHTLDKNRDKMYDSMTAMGKMGQQSIFTQLFNMDDYDPSKIETVINKVTDMGKVMQYLDAQMQTKKSGTRGGNIFEDAILDLEMLQNTFKAGTVIPADFFKKMTGGVADTFDLPKYKEGANAFDYLGESIDGVNRAAADNITIMTENVDSFNAFWSSIDSAREQVFAFKTNILELQNAITGLSAEVSDTFTDLSGQEHQGTLGMQIDVKSFDTAIDRMSKFSTMIKKYGSDWEEVFYDTFADKTYSMGKEEISYIDEYNTELKDSINIIHGFSAAQEEVKKVMNEVNKAIMRNNILIAELQLKGMMRRRGLTRAEEKKIKMLQIENMKERLKQKKAEQDAVGSIDKQAYEDAQQKVREYFDSQQFYLFLMKDARDDELSHMLDTFNRKTATLKHYQESLAIQEKHLMKAHQIELDLLNFVLEEYPAMAEMYEEIYGVSIPKSIQKSIDAMKEWESLQGKSENKPNKKQKAVVSYIKDTVSSKQQIKPQELIKLMNPRIASAMKRAGFSGFKRGIHRVPKDMLALIHQDEQIAPAGKDMGGDTITVNVNVTGNTISDSNVNNIANQIADQVEKGLINKRTGKSKYRLR